MRDVKREVIDLCQLVDWLLVPDVKPYSCDFFAFCFKHIPTSVYTAGKMASKYEI